MAPPSIRPEGLAQTLAALRTLSRMVKDAARAGTPFLRVFDARYGYLLKYNMQVSKGPQDVAVVPQPAPRREAPSAPQSKEAVEAKPAGSTGSRSRPRSPRKKRGGQKRFQMVGKSVYEERMGFWLAGDERENWYIGLGTHVPKHEGRSRQAMGNQCYLPRRARDCERKRACHWARDCPNRVQMNERPRRPARRQGM